ncbi:Glutathione S-transferase [Frankliniella fusca]|uniref:glutathione transferase n=1 Tax=Frankliniella fusca TaxID=407009 RepID=A0AAE1H4E4_9NEOP|nr:Glutathione S-transferase [Frankliniella fusca]
MAATCPLAGAGTSHSSPSYKLHYFHLAGLGEPIRYMLHYGGILFEDIRIGAEDWPEHKKSRTATLRICISPLLCGDSSLPSPLLASAEMPFGTMPVLEVDGVMYTQSRAICRFLAGRVGLAGAGPEECLRIDMIVDAFNDLRAAVSDWFYESSPQTKAAKLGPLVDKTIPYYLSRFEDTAKENSGYLANNKLSWADFYFCAPMTWFDAMLRRNVLDGYPVLQELRRRVDALPGVATYVASRTNSEKLCPRFVGP